MESSGQSCKGYIDNKYFTLFFFFEKKIDDKLDLTKSFAFNTPCVVWPRSGVEPPNQHLMLTCSPQSSVGLGLDFQE